MNDSTPLGTFEEQVMLAVLRTGEEAYGMNVRRELESVTGRDVAIGAVYATLDRLEAKGLVSSGRSGAGATSRRLFAVTAPGARALDESRIMRERLWEGVDLRPLLACLVLLLLLLPGAAFAQDPGEELRQAAGAGDVAKVKELLDRGVDVDAANSYGGTALLSASRHGSVEVVELLLARGADPNRKDTFYGHVPLTFALQRGHSEITRLLLAKAGEVGPQTLRSAVSGGKGELVQAVLERGQFTPEQLTDALGLAEQGGKSEAVKVLAAAGARPLPPANFEVDEKTLQSYTGRYEAADGFVITVSSKDRKLMGEAWDEILSFGALDPATFRAEEYPGLKLIFHAGNGKVTGVTLEENGSKMQLERKEAVAAASKLELTPCAGISGLPPEARCGIYEVWENRAAKSGRKIPLRVLVIPAQGPDRQPDPFVFFNGGPGESNVDAASWLVEGLGALLKRRDLLLVDFRGTGGTAALVCPEMQEIAGAQGFLDHFLPPDGAKACVERLAKTTDLTQYTNDTSVDDIDEVRAALGYEKINILGGSGGSRSGLVYLRRHPDRVRTAVLSGLVPTDERGPFWMARHAQRALDGLIDECKADEGCRTAFPRFREEVAAVLERIEKEPVTLPVKDGETGKLVEVRLTRNAVAQTLRYMLYNPAKAARLPWTVHQAAQGDWKPMAEEALSSVSGLGEMNRGYYLSLTCSEDLPLVREDEIPAAVQGTFLGDFRIRAQQVACAVWPVPPVGREFLEPVTSDVPVLLISGERDPVTPPGNAERAARTLKNSLHVVVPDAGHNYSGLEGVTCIDDLTVRFIEAGTSEGLDTSCLARIKRPEFVLKDPGVSK